MTDTELRMRLVRDLVSIMGKDYSSETECEKAMEKWFDEIERNRPEKLPAIRAAVERAADLKRRVDKAIESTSN